MQTIAVLFHLVLTSMGPLRGETGAERADRVARIAAAAYDAADGDARTAVVLLAVAAHESAFRADVDAGRCPVNECDGGRAVCIMQIHPVDAAERAELATHLGCFRVGRRRLGWAHRSCPEAPFSVYTTGHCDVTAGGAHAATVRAWLTRYHEQTR
jgi:hypothetical protein